MVATYDLSCTMSSSRLRHAMNVQLPVSSEGGKTYMRGSEMMVISPATTPRVAYILFPVKPAAPDCVRVRELIAWEMIAVIVPTACLRARGVRTASSRAKRGNYALQKTSRTVTIQTIVRRPVRKKKEGGRGSDETARKGTSRGKWRGAMGRRGLIYAPSRTISLLPIRPGPDAARPIASRPRRGDQRSPTLRCALRINILVAFAQHRSALLRHGRLPMYTVKLGRTKQIQRGHPSYHKSKGNSSQSSVQFSNCQAQQQGNMICGWECGCSDQHDSIRDRLFHKTKYYKYTTDKHNHVDDAPFGGGAGMLLQPQPIFDAMAAIEEETKDTCRQTLEGDVNIHIFGLGKIAENIKHEINQLSSQR